MHRQKRQPFEYSDESIAHRARIKINLRLQKYQAWCGQRSELYNRIMNIIYRAIISDKFNITLKYQRWQNYRVPAESLYIHIHTLWVWVWAWVHIHIIIIQFYLKCCGEKNFSECQGKMCRSRWSFSQHDNAENEPWNGLIQC